MGAGIAQIAALQGHRVYLIDAKPGSAAAARDKIAAVLASLVDKGRIAATDVAAAMDRMSVGDALNDLADAALVIEAISEDLDSKRSLFAALEQVVAVDCVLASNTSSISITALAAKMKHPGRVVGMHFFNPVPLMALVEIVHGLATEPAIAETVFETARAWGKIPVHAKSTPGFIVNRCARPFYAESLRLLNEQVASTATLDAIYRDCGGFRMGPFELMDLIGQDVNFAVTRGIWEAFFYDPRFTPSVMQQELVDAGHLGRKTGMGFFPYGGEALPPVADEEPVADWAEPIPCLVAGLGMSALVERLESASWRFQDAIGVAADELHVGEGAERVVLALSDGRSASDRAAQTGHPDLIVLDHAQDYRTTRRYVLTVAQGCSPSARTRIVSLLQRTGAKVTVVRDLPGAVVLRTVAMLVNEASDAANQGVATRLGIDIAMKKGVNYPLGPFEWGSALGVQRVRTVLASLLGLYGEDRYRISPLITDCAHAGRSFLP